MDEGFLEEVAYKLHLFLRAVGEAEEWCNQTSGAIWLQRDKGSRPDKGRLRGHCCSLGRLMAWTRRVHWRTDECLGNRPHRKVCVSGCAGWRGKGQRPESGARAVPTGWLAVVVPFTDGGTRRGGAGLGDKVKDMCDAYKTAKWTWVSNQIREPGKVKKGDVTLESFAYSW